MDQTKRDAGRDDRLFPRDEQELTPPHGDELVSEETFGRTDRYANLDEEAADRTERESGRVPPPGGVSGEMPGSARDEVIGRDGDTIVRDSITHGDADIDTRDEVDRKAP